MTLSLMPKRWWPWEEEDEDWLTFPSTQSGLSISEDDHKVYVEAAVPGIDPKNIEVTFQDGYLWIRGEKKEEEENKKKKYYRKASQSFSYRVAVPSDIDSNQEPEATYKRGVMTIAFTKSQKAQPKRIAIKTIKE